MLSQIYNAFIIVHLKQMKCLLVNTVILLNIFLIGQVFCDKYRGRVEKITFYMDINYSGRQMTMNMQSGVCYNFAQYKKQISSIQTYGGCILLYREKNCHKGVYKFEGGSSCNQDLTYCQMNDMAESAQLC